MVALDHYTRGEGGGGRWQASGCVRPLHEGEGGGVDDVGRQGDEGVALWGGVTGYTHTHTLLPPPSSLLPEGCLLLTSSQHKEVGWSSQGDTGGRRTRSAPSPAHRAAAGSHCV